MWTSSGTSGRHNTTGCSVIAGDYPVPDVYGGVRQVHTRSSILQRLLTPEAYHSGMLSQTLGIAGLPQIDLWRPD